MARFMGSLPSILAGKVGKSNTQRDFFELIKTWTFTIHCYREGHSEVGEILIS